MGGQFYIQSLKRDKHVSISRRTREAGDDKPLMDIGDRKEDWLDNTPHEEVYIDAFDGIKLHGFIVENPAGNDKFCIICHGYSGSPTQLNFVADKFYEKGFSLLMPSGRGHYKSGGEYCTMGWVERHDVAGWINYLNERFDAPEICLYGVSMGAGTVMIAAGEELPSNVKCAVEDCGFSSIKRQLAHVITNMFRLPLQPVFFFGRLAIKMKTGMDINREGEVTEQLSKSRIPMLFAHGGNDRFVPFYMLDECYSAHPGPKEKLVIEEALHASCLWTGDRYWIPVFDFVGKYIDIK
ncbi:MAG: alpha/beta hydrolase [Parasporobacterium sp.]|nr:alpha/beta hydrolase [Parasporobacterium sp.]